jgi:glycosyltransferase involved in cell wall biosynthesis
MHTAAKRPKLLLIADTYYPKVDGTMKFMEEFIKRTEDYFDLSILVPNYGAKKSKNVTYLDVSKCLQLSDYPSIKLSKKNRIRIQEAVKAADVVFVQGPALASHLGAYYGHKFHKPTLLYTHTLPWELLEKFLPQLVKKAVFRLVRKMSIALYNRCSEILVPYHDLKAYLEMQGVTAPVTIARLGVDIDKFAPEADKFLAKTKVGIPSDRMVIGYVGRVSKEKNISVLVNAFKRLRHQKKVYLLIVGDGPEKQVAELKELPNCKVTGFVHNVEDYLKAMDIFVMPSLTETTSLATLEAMSTGLPVIATKVGFIKRYIVRNHNGLFFPRNSASMLAVKMEKLLRDREMRHMLGQNARKTVAYSFSWERSINKIRKKLQEHCG